MTRISIPDNGALIGFFALELTFLCMLALRSPGLYEIASLRNGLRSIVLSIAACIAGGAFNYLLARTGLLNLPPRWLVAWMLLTAVYMTVTRGAAALWAMPLDRAGRFRKRIAIVGGGAAAEEAIQMLETSPGLDIDIVGLFDDRFADRSPQSVRTHCKLGKISELAIFAREHRIDLIIVAIPLSAEARLLQIPKRLWELPVDIRISGQASRFKLSPRAYTHLGKLPLLSVFDRPLTARGLVPQIDDGSHPLSPPRRAPVTASRHHRTRGEPQQRGTDPVQAAPLRLQQRAHRDL